MVASISDNTDMVTYEVMADVDIERLTTTTNRADNWLSRHTMAWTETQALLRKRDPPILEADLDSTDPLIVACCHYVAYMALKWAPSGQGDLDRAQWEYNQWIRSVEDAYLTVSGTERDRGIRGFQKAYRG